MKTRSYNFYFSSVATGDAKANVRIATKGVITAICFTNVGLAGASVDCQQKYEISKQSASSFTQNDAPASVLCRLGFVGNVNVGSYGGNALLAGLAHPVEANDVIYIHQLINGTAAANNIVYCTLVVSE